MYRRILAANDANLKEINKCCNGRLELQEVILGVIHDYNEKLNIKRNSDGSEVAPSSGGQQGLESFERRKANGAKKKAVVQRCWIPPIDPDGVTSLSGEIDLPKDLFTKGCKRYSGWLVNHFVALFSYVEPLVFNHAFDVNPNRTVCRQLFERCFGLRTGVVEGEESDSLPTMVKEQAYQVLLMRYIQLGRGFRSLNIRDGAIDWTLEANCVYGVSTVSRLNGTRYGEKAKEVTSGKNQFVVFCRLTGRVAKLPKGLASMDQDARDHLRIVVGYSATAARIVPPRQCKSDEIVISDLFPKTIRTLRRKSLLKKRPAVLQSTKKINAQVVRSRIRRQMPMKKVNKQILKKT